MTLLKLKHGATAIYDAGQTHLFAPARRASLCERTRRLHSTYETVCSEFWRIMDCAEDLSWAVFYYAGAASAAGITYRGALICSRTGAVPRGDEATQRIDAALAACGIRRWEMFEVDNCKCADAPLSVPRSGDTRLRAIAAPVPA